jgi:hypothetical protein
MAKGYSKLTKQPPPREPAMLDRRAADGAEAPYDQVAPGLYPDETAFELDDGSHVAISVETYWQPNGAGVAFHAYARWIDADGSSHTAPAEPGKDGQVEAAFTTSVTVDQAKKYGVDSLATDAARILLGEDPKEQIDVEVAKGDPPQRVPVLNVSDEVLANARIRDQIKLAKAARGFPKLAL